MKMNESTTDRVIRVVLGIVLIGLRLGGVVLGGWGLALAIAGVISLVTGIVGFCPLYAVLKLNTKKA